MGTVNMGTVKGIIDAKTLAIDVGGIIYKQGKAKVFNVLESQIEDINKLQACKRIVEDILTHISRDVAEFLLDTLEGWQIEIETDDILPEDATEEATREYQEVKEILRIHD